jgi:MFS family permease
MLSRSINNRTLLLVFLAVSPPKANCFSLATLATLTTDTSHNKQKHQSLNVAQKYSNMRKDTETNVRVGKSSLQLKSSDEVDESSSSSLWLLTLVMPLWLVYISNQWSRSSIYYLVNFSSDADPFKAINVEIGFSQAQYGLLASLAFTTLFAVASLGAGIAADRYNRKALTLIAAVGWSVATLGTALSGSYSEVVFWRVAMGLACAFSTPTAYTLIQQNVPKDRIAFAISLYGTGVAFGGALASLSILLDNELGWQMTLFIIAGFGMVAASLSALLLPDDPKDTQASPTAETPEIKESAFLEDVAEAISSARIKVG